MVTRSASSSAPTSAAISVNLFDLPAYILPSNAALIWISLTRRRIARRIASSGRLAIGLVEPLRSDGDKRSARERISEAFARQASRERAGVGEADGVQPE